MDTLVNVIILVASLLAIVGLIIGGTIKINTLMIGNKMSFLENKKQIFGIALIFAIGKYMPGLITFLRELHQSNLECVQELELMNEERKDL